MENSSAGVKCFILSGVMVVMVVMVRRECQAASVNSAHQPLKCNFGQTGGLT